MRSGFFVPLLLPCVLALVGCGGDSGSSPPGSGPLLAAPLGKLGGNNIALQVTATGGAVTLPCGGTGQLTQPLALDAGGHFDVTGTLSEGFGPPSATPSPPQTPAHFTGTTDGKTMTLTVTPTPLGAPTMGTYVLTYGAAMVTNIGGCPG